MLEAMKTLKINSLWVESGLVTHSRIEQLYRQYLNAEDKNTEHYRYALFMELLDNTPVFDDSTVEAYIKLCQLDCDQSMAGAALIRLIWSSKISSQQLNGLPLADRFEREKEHSILYRRVIAEPISDELFNSCLENWNAVAKREILKNLDLSEEQLFALSTRGKSKAVRNMAKGRLKR